MNLVLFDEPLLRTRLLPLTFTRPIADIRIGILKISEKWEKISGISPSYLTEPYLSKKYPLESSPGNILVNGAVCPDQSLWESVSALELGEALYKGDLLLAANLAQNEISYPLEIDVDRKIAYEGSIEALERTWDIFIKNGEQLRSDFTLLTKGRVSKKIDDPHTIVYGAENIFIEEGVKVRASIINAEDGPIYIGKNVDIQEGSIIKGPVALCESVMVRMGAKIREDTTIGPYSKVGGEVTNVVIMGRSNKAHEGFLGSAVIGEWCNLGADTNNSNLKNNYANVRLWDYESKRFINTGLQFCGMIMGDHSKCGINTMFNTGTVIGVGANIYGSGFPRNYVPSFSWGGAAGFMEFKLSKFFEVAEISMARKNVKLTSVDRKIIEHIFETTSKNRRF